MKAKFISGPLHGQVLDVGDDPPPGWVAPTVPLDRNSREEQFRPLAPGPWDDLSTEKKLDVHEYERSTSADGDTIYLLKTLHRKDGSKLHFGGRPNV